MKFTPRQKDILREIMSGDTNKAIAQRLGITEGTVKMMLHLIYEKTGARNRTQLAMMNSQRNENVIGRLHAALCDANAGNVALLDRINKLNDENFALAEHKDKDKEQAGG